MSGAITESIDVAQVVLYVFWMFFFGLIFWLRREDRREGYPLESDNPRRVGSHGPVLVPPAKTFVRPDGSTYDAPNFLRDERPIQAERTAAASGAPLEPTGDPLYSGVGPAAWAERSDHPELTREGHHLIVPMRVAGEYSVSAGPDPRGWKVVGADGAVAGTVKDLWVDRADVMVRYLEVELDGGERRLVPAPVMRLLGDPKQVEVTALRSTQFAGVPALKNPDHISLQEEERISAFYAGGRLYADPKRVESVV